MNDSFELSTEEDFDVLGGDDDDGDVLQVDLAAAASSGHLPQPPTNESAGEEVNFGTMNVVPPPPSPLKSPSIDEDEPAAPPTTTEETSALAAFAASVGGSTGDARLIDELQKDNERLAASLALSHDRLRDAEDAWNAERDTMRREIAELKTEQRLASASTTKDSAQVDQAKRELFAVRSQLRVVEQQAVDDGLRAKVYADKLAAQEDELDDLRMQRDELRRGAERSAAQHEERVHALHEEFEKLRFAHEQRMTQVARERDDLEDLEQMRAEFNSELDVAHQENARLKSDNKKLADQARSLDAELQKKLSTSQDLPPIKEMEDKVNRLESLNADLSARLDELSSSLRASEDALEMSRNQDRVLHERLERQERLATLAASDASNARSELARAQERLEKVASTPADVAVSALSGQVSELERRLEQRQKDISDCVQNTKTACRLELARAEARHRDDLAAKDAQLERFRFELDRLLDALRFQLTKKTPYAAAAATENDKQDPFFIDDLLLDDLRGS